VGADDTAAPNTNTNTNSGGAGADCSDLQHKQQHFALLLQRHNVSRHTDDDSRAFGRVLQYPQQQSRNTHSGSSDIFRSFHSTCLRRDGDNNSELSEKDEKKMLKEKAKAIMEERERAKAEADAEPKKDSPPPPSKESAADVPTAPVDSATRTEDDDMSEPPTADHATKSSSSSSASAVDAAPAAVEGSKSAAAAAAPPAVSPPSGNDGSGDAPKEYSFTELTADAAKHKAGLKDPTRPNWQNPLHHNNPEMSKIFEEDFATKEEFEAAVLPAPPLADPSGAPVGPPHIVELADEIVNLTMLEMNELLNKIADHYGFHEGILSPGADPSGAGSGGDDDDDDDEGKEKAVEKTTFDVKLMSYDDKAKIKIIKEVRAIVTGLGLKEAKALVEGAPVAVMKNVNKELAEEIKAKLEAVGAVMEVS
jgi:large subunit ribosomal protein L7/L12